MIVAIFIVPNFMFEIIKTISKVNWIKVGDDEIRYESYVILKRISAGIKVSVVDEAVGT